MLYSMNQIANKYNSKLICYIKEEPPLNLWPDKQVTNKYHSKLSSCCGTMQQVRATVGTLNTLNFKEQKIQTHMSLGQIFNIIHSISNLLLCIQQSTINIRYGDEVCRAN